MSENTALAAVPAAPSLITKFAARFGVEPNKMVATLKATAFHQSSGDISNEQMMALLVVADQYGLNPFTREIYAFPDKNRVVPIVGVDGWARIINEQPQCDGVEFTEPATVGDQPPAWIECIIHRKDRKHPTRVKEYWAECKRDTGPWRSHPRRMLRHKAMVQAARIAFGFVGIHDEDEAQRIIEGNATLVPAEKTAAATIEQLNKRLAQPEQQQPAVPDDRQPLELDGNPPPITFASVMDGIERAQNVDQVDVAADLIGEVPDPAHRAELAARAKERRKELAK